MKHWKQVRTAILTLAFTAAAVIGAVNATASSEASAAPPVAPAPAPASIERLDERAPATELDGATETPAAACTGPWFCREECAPFEGQFISGRCHCCG